MSRQLAERIMHVFHPGVSGPDQMQMEHASTVDRIAEVIEEEWKLRRALAVLRADPIYVAIDWTNTAAKVHLPIAIGAKGLA